jgi:hypothetical protein
VESHSSLFTKPSDGEHKEQPLQRSAQQQQQQQQQQQPQHQCSPGATTHHQTQLMQAMLQTLNSMQPNQQQVPPPPPPHQSHLAEFLRTRPTTFSQAKEIMDAEDWLKGVKKKLMITQCTDREKVLFAAHQLYGTTANWWETYCNTHANVDTITWNEFKARF